MSNSPIPRSVANTGLQAVALIPAYKPALEFPCFVRELISIGICRVVVVDDGSGLSFRSLFDEVAILPGVKVLRHAVNLGKGAALKTGINAILCDYADASVVVTADADGQHAAEDVAAIAALGEVNPRALVLGVRSFDDGVPLRSRFGNQMARLAMRLVVGQNLKDTQTGLRAIPYCLLPDLLKIAPQGYDFELAMLLRTRERRLKVLEAPIRTIYIDRNASSHFNPLLDSTKIYFLLVRFAAVSLSASIIDNLIFFLVFRWTGGLAQSQVIARTGSMLYNFTAAKRVVFKSRRHLFSQAAKYVVLVLFSGAVSFVLIKFLVTYTVLNVFAAKILAESLLFFVNFLIQRDIIFTDDGADENAAIERNLRAAANSTSLS